ncbi:hypothetical protein D3C73_751670 [compost metagenome]
MQTAQTLDLVIDITRLHRTAARAVDAQDDALDLLVLESRTQAANDIVCTGRLLVGNHASHIDQRRVIGTKGAGLFHIHQRRKQGNGAEQIHKNQKLEEYPPATGPALLLYAGQQGLFQQFPAFVVTALCARLGGRLPFVGHAIHPKNNRLSPLIQPGMQF